MFDWNAQGPAAIVGAVVATIGVLALEVWLKPRYARKRVATILLAELEINAVDIASALDQMDLGSHRPVTSTSAITVGWDAAKAEAHYLPSDTLRILLKCYGQFEALDEIARQYLAETSVPHEGGIRGMQRGFSIGDLGQRFKQTLTSAVETCRAAIVILRRDLDDSAP